MSGKLSKPETSTPPLPAAFSILVCGRTGIGKSTLINFIVGEDVCSVGDPGAADEDDYSAFDPKTKDVTGHTEILNEVAVTIFDSPGLQDGTEDEASYLKDMKAKCSDVDLVLYCLEMTQTRWTPPETNALRLLTETFGAPFWGKTVVVLTKANQYQSARRVTDAESSEQFSRLIKRHEKRFRDELIKVIELGPNTEDHTECVSTVPAVPAGSEAVQVLPNGKHFIGNIWVTCAMRVSPEVIRTFTKATGIKERLIAQEDIETQGKNFKDVMNDMRTGLVREVLEPIVKKIKQELTLAPDNEGTAEQLEKKSCTLQSMSLDIQSGSEKDDSSTVPKYPIVIDEEDTKKLHDKYVAGGLTVSGAVVGSAVGGGLGSIVPVVGTFIGAAIGGVVGTGLGGLIAWLRNS